MFHYKFSAGISTFLSIATQGVAKCLQRKSTSDLIIASTKSFENVTTQSSNVGEKMAKTNLCLWYLLPGYLHLEIIQHSPFHLRVILEK